jgi:hypothetical protein
MSTYKITNRTIEISDIDEDYLMPQEINVDSVVLIPATNPFGYSFVDIYENSEYISNPVKVQLYSGDDEPRVWYTYQRLQLGFHFKTSFLTAGSKVIFNIGEVKGR